MRMFFARLSRILVFLAIITVKVLIDALADIDLGPILIEKTANYSEVLEGKNLSTLGYNSPQEALDYFSSIDLRKRSSFGIQQDLSIRGSIFEDNEVCLEGVRVNDPQTGHFNLELPLTEYDIGNITLDSNSQRVSFNIAPPKEKGIFIKHYWGQHALYADSVSLNFKTVNANNRISYEHKISSGIREDTDFNIHNLFMDSLWNWERSSINLIFGMTQRDFGADSFYSSLYPHEEEHTRQKLLLVKSNITRDKFSLVNSILVRFHSDKFILDRENPLLYINHTTSRVYNWDSRIKLNGFYFGFSLNKERIKSESMGGHTRYRKEFYLDFNPKMNNLSLDISLNETRYGEFGWLEKTSLGSSYRINNKLILRLVLSYLWRAPSFTELYYQSPANHGNNSLSVQKTLNYETGLKYILNKDVNLHFSVFMRRQSHTIDWIKNSEASPWEAENVGKIKAKGIDCGFKICLRKYHFEYLSLDYTYLALNREDSYIFHKYAFDYLRHKITANLFMKVHKFRINYMLNFSGPAGRKNYCVSGLKIVRKINNNIDFFIEGDNIFNSSYYELDNIKGDSRWYKLGISLSF